jgi:TolB protein
LLAERTAQDFVARLAKGDATSAFDLYLTDEARKGEAGQMLSRFTGTNPHVVDATLLEFRRATASSYEARALLRWEGVDEGGPATQTMTLLLAPQRGLWLIDNISLGDLQASTATPTRKPRASTGQPASRLEGRLVFQTSTGGDIYIINADGTGLRRLTDGLDPVWSPDGTQVALARWREPRGLWIVDADSTGASGGEQRVFDWSETRGPAWSPDGSQLVFSRQHGGRLEEVEKCFWRWCFTLPPNPHWKLAVLRLDDSALREPPSSDLSQAPSWSPDGSRIVYHSDRGLSWIDPGGDANDSGNFAGSSGWDTSPSFSPDGKRIAFVGRAHTNWEIFAMNADGSGRKQLTYSGSRGDEALHSVAPAWSPDGKQIAFLSNRDGPWRISVMNADGSEQRPMFGDQLDGLGLRYGFASERVLSWSE